jgi:hypothetical protein
MKGISSILLMIITRKTPIDSGQSMACFKIPPRFATREELEMVHLPSYIDMIASTSGQPARRLDPDTVTSPKSYEAACLAGGVLEAIEAVLQGKLDNAFALVRPPGHHAERNRAMGFCIFNNIAVGAKYAISKGSLLSIGMSTTEMEHKIHFMRTLRCYISQPIVMASFTQVLGLLRKWGRERARGLP